LIGLVVFVYTSLTYVQLATDGRQTSLSRDVNNVDDVRLLSSKALQSIIHVLSVQSVANTSPTSLHDSWKPFFSAVISVTSALEAF